MDAKHSLGEPRVLISRDALLHNAAVIRRAVGADVKICAIIKANAYGHGADLVADALSNFSSDSVEGPAADMLAVADLDEAGALAETRLPILIFRPVENAYLGRQRSRLEAAIHGGWTLTIASPAAADDVARIALACGKRANIHVMIDTGMSRAGIDVDDFARLIEKVQSLPFLRLASVSTHFACSEEPNHPFNAEQLRRFLASTDVLPNRLKPIRHAANSGAIFLSPAAHLDMVRPGISLYGIDPTGRPTVDRPLQPVMKWTAPLVGVREVPAGATVGYGQTWTAPRASRVGLVPVGYADGYSREFSSRGVMLVGGKCATVVGRVSMDFTTIDVTDIPQAMIGDEVTILDSDPLSPASVYRLAEWAGTLPYEVFCRIGARVRRVAVDPGDADARSARAEDDSVFDPTA